MPYEQRGKPQILRYQPDPGSVVRAVYSINICGDIECAKERTIKETVGGHTDGAHAQNLKPNGCQPSGYMSLQEAHQDISRYLMQRYNWIRPNNSMAGWYQIWPMKIERRVRDQLTTTDLIVRLHGFLLS